MKSPELIHSFVLDMAKAAVFTLFILLTTEAFIPGSVGRFFNLLWLIVLIVLSSVVAFATHHERERKPPTQLWLVLLGLVASLYTWVSLTGVASYPWRIIATLITLVLSWLLWPLLSEDRSEGNES